MLEDKEERWIGVLLLHLRSHITICPEYVPAITKFGWNIEKHDEVIVFYICQKELTKIYDNHENGILN